MQTETTLAADRAIFWLQRFANAAEANAEAVVVKGDIAELAAYFKELRDAVREAKALIEDLEEVVETLSHDTLPTLFANANVKSMKIVGVGNVVIAHRFTASMPDKSKGLAWLRAHDAESLIIETVNAQTLASFAKERALSGEPLPNDVFAVAPLPYTSIRSL